MTAGYSAVKPDSDLRLTIDAAPTDADLETIEHNLDLYNEQKSRPYDRAPLAVFLRGPDDEHVGGLTGYTQWDWLYVDCFWLPDRLRGMWWGSRLLKTAEIEAVRRGCKFSRLYTYSFQALGFYITHGYELFGTLEDYPPGHCQHWLRKTLVRDGSRAQAAPSEHRG